MNDNELMEELQIAIEQFTDGVSAPAWLPARARQIARRRAISRTVGTGGCVVAAAGVATLLASGPAGPTTPRHALANLPQAHDTAYIVKHVQAALATSTAYVTESVLPDGEQDWMYVDPTTGVQYQRDIYPPASATAGSVTGIVATPVNGYLHFDIVNVDNADHTWTQSESVASAPIPTGVEVGGIADLLGGTPQQIEHALANLDVTQTGTTTVNGTAAIELSFPDSGTVTGHANSQANQNPPEAATSPISGDTAATSTATLYIDSQTYQPLTEVWTTPTSDGGTATNTQNWLPATPANIALTKLTVPSDYTREAPPGK
jgi:hypothetical protein